MSKNKWIKLDGKKDSPHNEAVALWIHPESSGMGFWAKGTLSRIEFVGNGKKYVFDTVPVSDYQYTDATHYMIIEPPKDNQANG